MISWSRKNDHKQHTQKVVTSNTVLNYEVTDSLSLFEGNEVISLNASHYTKPQTMISASFAHLIPKQGCELGVSWE